MRFRGFNLLRVCGIQIVIDYSWFIIFFLVMYTMAVSYFPQNQKNYATPQYWIMGLAAALLLFASVLIHELAHSFVALKQGIHVSSIRLFIFGGVSQIASEPSSGRQEFLIAIAGPATSMALAFLFAAAWVVLWFSGTLAPVAAVVGYLAGANALLALFNLIPGFPLDGGRLLRAILWDRWNNMARATRVVSQLGNSFALFLIVLGVLLFLLSQALIFGLWLIFIGLFMKQSATGNYQALMVRQALAGVQIRQIMTENVICADWLTPVDGLVRDFIYKHKFTNYPVFNREEFVGMVSLDAVKEVPKELWAFKQVRDIMTPVEQIASLKPTDDVTDALARMLSTGIGKMPVVENGQLVGIVSRRDIMNLFKVKSDLGVA
jgi:Zn-dependent protease/predicted transcriptional regulator